MQDPRYEPACTTGYFGDQYGIFVTSGTPYESDPSEDSVEFYVAEANTWIYLRPLQEKRSGHNIFEVNGQLMVAGGGPLSTEVLNGTNWERTLDLRERRWSSAGVTVPEGYLDCKQSSP